MKKTFTLLVALFMVGIVFADGWKPLSSTSTTYAPDPNSADIGNAFNIYAGFGKVHGSNFGFSIGADFEFPVIDPNLTLGPQFGFGMHQYGVPYIDNNGNWQSSTAQLSFNGGVIARYYADWLIPNMPEEFDVFITSNAGLGFVTYTSYYSSKMYFDWGTSIGGRWNFSESMSLYAQVGYGATNVSIGLSWKM